MSEEDPAEERFYLLLDHEAENDALAKGMALHELPIELEASALALALPAKEQKGHLFNENKDANSLLYQKWGIIRPKGARGEELLGFVAELVAHREKEQGMKVVPFEVEPNMDAKAALDWVVNTLSVIEKDARPRYLLILGDLHEVSAELQIALSARYFAGRLAFSTGDEYRAYVAKVIRHETVEPKAKQCEAFCYSVRHDDLYLRRAINDAEGKLVQSMLELASERHEKGKIPVKYKRRNTLEVSTRDEMLEVLRSAPVPSLLLSVSHGRGISRDKPEAEKRNIQGALVFDGGYLTAEDAKTGPFLPGGFWFLFACYGAGTPKTSVYQHWHKMQDLSLGLPKPEESPYIAALPKAALANPEGPLAIVGHLDLALTSSYDAAAGFSNQPARFVELADIANKKDWRRVGPIFGDFIRDLVDVNAKITNAIDAEQSGSSPPMDRQTRTRLWMLRQDLASYVLLGDPAAYLPFQRRVPRPAWADPDEKSEDDE